MPGCHPAIRPPDSRRRLDQRRRLLQRALCDHRPARRRPEPEHDPGQDPAGLLRESRGIPYCSEETLSAIAARRGYAEQASPSCPAASQIGTGWAGAGAGSRPLYVPGRVYLAGPYKGAPLSFAIVTPAVSGPYDLGTVVVRAAAYIDPVTAQITTTADPLPQILEGIPLRLRTVMINLDRPGSPSTRPAVTRLRSEAC